MRLTSHLFPLLSFMLSAAPVMAGIERGNPEPGTGTQKRILVKTGNALIVAANPHASGAGLQILKQGGNAIDAAIATQLVLNLVEPQSSGIGGGGFLLYWENCKQALVALDGRETAPVDATPGRFVKKGGAAMTFGQARSGRHSVGTPGLVSLMATAHKKYGRLDWQKLFVPATELAKNGFRVSPRLHKLLRWRKFRSFGPDAQSYFFDKAGQPRPVGYLLKNPAFARTLEELARKGGKAFYQPGHRTSSAIIKKVWRSGERNISYKDLSSYRTRSRQPLCTYYRGYKICGMGPPSSGAIVVGQVLKMIEPLAVAGTASQHDQIMRMAMAEKLAYADRKRYIADPAFVTVPKGLLDESYLRQRATLIPPAKMLRTMPAGGSPQTHHNAILQAVVPPGTPPDSIGLAGKDQTTENDGTSHISIIDAEGNVLSMTTTIEAGFGSGLMAGGFLLNNELTDFSFLPKDRAGRPVANRIEPGKRPRSSMAPTIIFDPKGKPFMTLGSPGGSRIPLYVLKTIVAIIDWNMDAQQAVNFPNFGSRNKKGKGIEIEKGQAAQGLASRIAKSPVPFSRSTMNSGLHIIVRRKNHLEAGVDPRREGHASGY